MTEFQSINEARRLSQSTRESLNRIFDVPDAVASLTAKLSESDPPLLELYEQVRARYLAVAHGRRFRAYRAGRPPACGERALSVIAGGVHCAATAGSV